MYVNYIYNSIYILQHPMILYNILCNAYGRKIKPKQTLFTKSELITMIPLYSNLMYIFILFNIKDLKVSLYKVCTQLKIKKYIFDFC
jgi:hypothetical protein